MQKIRNIQALRGIAVLAVVFYHLIIIEKRYGGSAVILPGFLEFGTFGVDLFFVISGFVMVTVTRGKFQLPKKALTFLYHRASRIYPLYWVYTLMALTVFLVQPSWVNSSQGNRVDVLASFLLLPSKLLPLVQVGWTLVHEMYFYLVYFLIILFLPEKFLLHALGIWGLSVFAFDSLALSNSASYRLVFSPLTLEFLSGCLLGVLYHRREGSNFSGGWMSVIAGASLLASIFGYVAFHNLFGTVPDGWWRVLIYGLPAFSIVFCMTDAERTGNTMPPALTQTGDASYSIYLSHLFTLNVVGRIWGIFATEQVYDNVVVLIIALILALVVGFLSYRFIETPLLKLSRRVS